MAKVDFRLVNDQDPRDIERKLRAHLDKHRDPVILPTMAGTGPLYPFVTTLGLPNVDIGIGYPDAAIHAPNENIRLEDFRAGTKAIAAFLGMFGG